MMLKIMKRLTRLALLLAAMLLAATAATAGNRVQKVSPEEFDALIRGEGSKTVVVGLASWCGPCKRELPDLVDLYATYRDKGLRLVGLSLDFGGPGAMQPVMDEYEVDFPVYWTGEEAVERYSLHPIPMLLFVEDGRIVKRITGGRDRAALERLFADFLSRPHS